MGTIADLGLGADISLVGFVLKTSPVGILDVPKKKGRVGGKKHNNSPWKALGMSTTSSSVVSSARVPLLYSHRCAREAGTKRMSTVLPLRLLKHIQLYVSGRSPDESTCRSCVRNPLVTCQQFLGVSDPSGGPWYFHRGCSPPRVLYLYFFCFGAFYPPPVDPRSCVK